MARRYWLGAIATLAAVGCAQDLFEAADQEGGRLLEDTSLTIVKQGPGASLAFDDATTDFNCVLGQNCTGNGMPVERGLCVRVGLSNECWDVCNPKHAPQDYRVGDRREVNSAMAGLVAEVRAGFNSFVQCPSELAQGDPCPPGGMCPYSMRRRFKVPTGRGMCVVDASQPDNRACWDMCNLRIDPADYAEGTSKDAPNKVREARSNGTCPGTPWWRWLLYSLLILAVLVCAVFLFVSHRMKRGRGAGAFGARGEQDYEEYDEEYPEDQQPDQRDEAMHQAEQYVSAHGHGHR